MLNQIASQRNLISLVKRTKPNMKKFALLFILPLVLSLVTVAAQKKEGSSESTTTEQHVVLNPADLKWGDAPPGLPPGGKMAVLSGDPTKKGLFTVRLQTPAGYKIPAHSHPTAEHITVISGNFNVGAGDKFDEATGKELAPGSFVVMPANMNHFAWSTGEAIVQIHGKGPFAIKYVNPADDSRQAKK
jgi:quercetin dioxygenase-like cupin family protein